jgi:hypothetical protein
MIEIQNPNWGLVFSRYILCIIFILIIFSYKLFFRKHCAITQQADPFYFFTINTETNGCSFKPSSVFLVIILIPMADLSTIS